MEEAEKIMKLVDALIQIPPWASKSVREKAREEVRVAVEHLVQKKCLGCNSCQLS